MKKYSIITILTFLALIMSSCRDLPIDVDPNGGGGWEKDDDRDDDKKDPIIDYNYGPGKCFDFIYPVTYMLPDRTRMMFNSREEINIRMNEWHKMHPDFNGRAMMVFPVEIVYPDGTVKVINNQQELEMAKKACDKVDKDNNDGRDDKNTDDKDDSTDKPCVTHLYPIYYMTPDGQRIEIKDEVQHKMFLDKWSRNASGLAPRGPQLMFPIKVMTASGEIVAVYSQEELDKLRKDCDRDSDPNGGGSNTGGGRDSR